MHRGLTKKRAEAPEEIVNLSRRFRPILAAGLTAVLMTGCSIFNPKHPVELSPAQVIPIPSAELQAPRNALPVAMTRPRDLRSGQEVHRTYDVPLFPIPIAITHSFLAEGDAGVWVGNGLSSGLENAGYRIEHVEKAADAKTPVVVSLDVTSLEAKAASHWFSIGCTGMIAAQIKIAKSGQPVFDRAYDAQAEEPGTCPASASKALTKALEKLLDQAVPQVAASLSVAALPAGGEAAALR
jgi:hypothetical protein